MLQGLNVSCITVNVRVGLSFEQETATDKYVGVNNVFREILIERALQPRFTEPLFDGSRSVQVKSIKDWYNIINKIHFTTEDSMKHFEVIEKIKNTLL